MKLRNKKTGEIFDALIREKGGGGSYSLIVCDIKAYEQSKSTLDATHFVLEEYDSLAELNEEWEDYEEKSKEWYINEHNEPEEVGFGFPIEDIESLRELGLLFETKEETELVIRKLKAWKRLKDRGFRFTAWYGGSRDISFYISQEKLDKETAKDLDLLFGGEE